MQKLGVIKVSVLLLVLCSRAPPQLLLLLRLLFCFQNLVLVFSNSLSEGIAGRFQLAEVKVAKLALEPMNPGAGCDVLCPHSLEKLDGSIVAEKGNKDFPKIAEANECTVSLGPITPDAGREHGDIYLDFESPITVAKKQLKLSGNGDKVAFVDNCSPQTPKDGVFDPFAPGPDDMVRAPQCRKYLDELRDTVSRQLKFDPCNLFAHENSGDNVEVESLSDQEMFESVYENLLEAIVSMQTEDALAEMKNVEYVPINCKTPPSELQRSGIADTCPDAPLKPRGTPRIIPVELCRKLEF
ncbi:hypothetical protein L6164_000017 [Bauhinia variegata]|uniref:Uncharacterized protein n=1 Tax=Bauhinia variegata TaxID=167791 RepID=A0ACB9Q570_BAUVA|nr:hypothetical protein L6164_000017 [Bauhinia variegata]